MPQPAHEKWQARRRTAGRAAVVAVVLIGAGASAGEAPEPAAGPGEGGERGTATFLPLHCVAEQTGGFHDYPDDEASYAPALFNVTPFQLEENAVFMRHLAPDSPVDLYVTLTAGEDPVTTELECRQVRGIGGSIGYSCVNIPPSELLLINRDTLRFTRTAVGGWTFAAATDQHAGDSIFVEYGTCRAGAEAGAAGAASGAGAGTDHPAEPEGS